MPDSVFYSNLILFADGSLLYKDVSSDADATEFLSDVDKLSDWADTWQMSFNTKKCEHMGIARRTCTNATNVHSYNLTDKSLPSVSCIKVSGSYY